jgi:hypothetical protein
MSLAELPIVSFTQPWETLSADKVSSTFELFLAFLSEEFFHQCR